MGRVQLSINWKASTRASGLAAAAACLDPESEVPEELATVFSPLANTLRDKLFGDKVHWPLFLENVLPTSAIHDSAHFAAQSALGKLIGLDWAKSLASKYGELITNLEQTFIRVRPEAASRLETRRQSLQTRWRNEGPPLLSAIANLTEPAILVSDATIVIIDNVGASMGTAFPAFNTILYAAGDADPAPKLPETARLAWLFASLNLDLPLYRETTSSQRIGKVGPLSLIPPVLNAAWNQGELCELSPQDIEFALRVWLPHETNTGDTAIRLSDWWQVYVNSKPAWPTAMKGLDHLLEV